MFDPFLKNEISYPAENKGKAYAKARCQFCFVFTRRIHDSVGLFPPPHGVNQLIRYTHERGV